MTWTCKPGHFLVLLRWLTSLQREQVGEPRFFLQLPPSDSVEPFASAYAQPAGFLRQVEQSTRSHSHPPHHQFSHLDLPEVSHVRSNR